MRERSAANLVRRTILLSAVGLLVTAAFGLIGFFDDFVKVRKKRNLGLTAKQKYALQVVVAAVASRLAISTERWKATGRM